MSYEFDYTLFMMCPSCANQKKDTKTPCPAYKAMGDYIKERDHPSLKLYLRIKDGVAICSQYKEKSKTWAKPAEIKESAEKEKLQESFASMAMTQLEDNNTVGQQETLM